MTELAVLTARIERLEALDQIRQLPAKNALSVDMRDFDAPKPSRVGRNFEPTPIPTVAPPLGRLRR